MSARSEELEGLREGEPVDGAAASPDETVLLDAVAPGDAADDATDSVADRDAKDEHAEDPAAESDAAPRETVRKTVPRAGGEKGDSEADAAAARRDSDADESNDSDVSDASGDSGDLSESHDAHDSDDADEPVIRRRSTPAPAAADSDPDPDRHDGDIKRRSTPRDGIPHKRDHGLPKYEEPRATSTASADGDSPRAANGADRHQHDRPTAAMAAEAAAVAASGVAQDVADETARAVAEAAGDGDGDPASGATASVSAAGPEGADDLSAAAPPRRPDRHTFLYGKGFRVLPWKHKSRLAPPQRRRRRIVVRSLWACVLVCFATVGWSVGKALTAPGTDTIQVRLAEWGRDHGLGGVVSTLEKWQYDLNPPKKGGTVDQNQFADLGPTAEPVKPSATKGGKPGAQPPAADLIAMRPALTASAGLALEPGEGVFHPAVSTPDNQPVVQLARIRPDSVYTSVTEDVLWIDQKHTRYVLHPGHEGGVNKQVPVPNQINPDARPGLIALFNGGFKISESHGGYFDHGVTVAPLADGAASEVIFADGHMSVGMWGRDFSFAKNPNIVTVRQNLKLMVDDGKVVPYIDDAANWGRSDHGSAAVWRSGVGVTAAGDIVYVAGNDLTAPSLADLLQRAGAVHAMQLDINLRWADFQYFPDRDGNPENSKLYGDFLQGATKFFYDSTKDFMAVYLR